MPSSTAPADVSLVDRIDAILPQTQCRKCSFDGCRPYAEAIAANEADINQCPPGGAEGIRQLAALLEREAKPLNPAHGVEQPRAIARIDENFCIGCTLCIKACPVDAIVGSAKLMHTVVAPLCTGCELCLAPCPVDCIVMEPVSTSPDAWGRTPEEAKDVARERYQLHQQRIAREKAEKAKTVVKKTPPASETGSTAAPSPDPDADAAAARKKAMIAAALERARQQRQAVQARNTTDVSPQTQAKIDEIEARRARGRADSGSDDTASGGD